MYGVMGGCCASEGRAMTAPVFQRPSRGADEKMSETAIGQCQRYRTISGEVHARLAIQT